MRTLLACVVTGALGIALAANPDSGRGRAAGARQAAASAPDAPATADETAAERQTLTSGWAIQSSAKIQAQGAAISSTGFPAMNWYPASVPSTVVAALVRDKVFPDPYYGMNLRLIPGEDYPIGYNFSHLPMSPASPFAVSWWYITEFALPAAGRGRRVWLDFDGINYRANIWVNGQEIATSDVVEGTFRTYEFDITAVAKPGAENTLAVEVFPPTPADLALTWVDWNPAPPDKDMGLWRSVFVTTTGPVTVRYPDVISEVELGKQPSATLRVEATLRNASGAAVSGTLRGTIGKTRIEQAETLAAGETRRVAFTPGKFRQLRFARPKLWWPWELGRPNLYRLTLEFETDGAVSDRQTVEFGIREIGSKLTVSGRREFSVNGEPLLIRGGGWAPDMLLRFDPQRTAAEFGYVRELGLNTIRLEGKLIDRDFFEQADHDGLLVMAGWCCCDRWEEWKLWSGETERVAAESLRSQIRRLRTHPSLLVWLNGSDNPPPAHVEQMYLGILRELDWPNPILSSASGRATAVTGASGVKMTGPYNWVAPAYWYEDRKAGGARGFNTETSPGPAPMPRESLERMLPAAHLWPIDDFWNFHAGGGRFKTLEVFNQALAARYGPAKSLDDYLEKSQVMAYEGERAMYEAYTRNRYESTGVIQWMLNDAWPGLIWHLWDYYLVPGGGYYGVKQANQPIHIQYSYDDGSVVVSNRTRREASWMRATATIYGMDSRVLWRRSARVRVGADALRKVFDVSQVPGLPVTYLLELTLRNSAGSELSGNWYWLSTKPDAWNQAKADYALTPATAYADLRGLETLAEARIEATASEGREAAWREVTVRVRNASAGLAFFVHFRLTWANDGLDAVPVYWSNNDVTLGPGERRTLVARIPDGQFASGRGPGVKLEIKGWNVAGSELRVRER